MLDYDTLKHNDRKFAALTGLTPQEFQQLLPSFERAHARGFPADQTQAGQPRQGRRRGGRKAVLHDIVGGRAILRVGGHEVLPVEAGGFG